MSSDLMGLTLAPSARRPSRDGLEFLFRALSPREAGEYLHVPEESVLAEAESGRLPGQQIDGQWRFIGLALAHWLMEGSRPAAGSKEAPSAGTTGTKFAREQEAFRTMLPDLLRTHRGEYVAIHEGRVVASGHDNTAVARAAFEEVGAHEMLVELVTDEPPRVVYLWAPPVVAPELA
jgi:hypothetical protein